MREPLKKTAGDGRPVRWWTDLVWVCATSAAALVIAAGAAGVALLAWTSPTCENTYLKSVLSPDRRMEAVLFTQNCGATARLDTELAILPAGRRSLPRNGNVTLQDQSRRWYLELGGADVRLAWRNRDALEIRCGPSAQILDRAAHAGKVAVDVESDCLCRLP